MSKAVRRYTGGTAGVTAWNLREHQGRQAEPQASSRVSAAKKGSARRPGRS